MGSLWAYNGLFQERGAAYMIWVRPGRLLRVSDGRVGCGACVLVLIQNDAVRNRLRNAFGAANPQQRRVAK